MRVATAQVALFTMIVVSWCGYEVAAQGRLIRHRSTLGTAFSHGIAYDSLRNRMVMVAPYGNTWERMGTVWAPRALSTLFPSIGDVPIVFDSHRRRIVAYDGLPTRQQTWEYDGFAWQAINIGSKPRPGNRVLFSLAFDTRRKRTVLFGGRSSMSFPTDTWEWDGSAWTVLNPKVSPPGRTQHKMVYDSARGVVVLFGGEGSDYKARSDTWEWDGSSWKQASPSINPATRFRHGMAFDSLRKRTVLFGGYSRTSKAYLSDTWEWDGKDWTKINASAAPHRRAYHSMAYDPVRRRTVLVGGRYHHSSAPGWTEFTDTWEWDGSAWTRITGNTSIPNRSPHGFSLVYDSKRERAVLFGGVDNGSYPRSVFEWDGKEWALNPTTSAQPSGRVQHAAAFDSARGKTVVFGGSYFSGTSQVFLSDTWEWDGSVWTSPNLTVHPSKRQFHAMAYDANRRKAVLFGGVSDTGVYLNDTWEWGGMGWARVATTLAPAGRGGHQMAFDSKRNRTVLFGGGDGRTAMSDVWEWDGTTWQKKANAHPSTIMVGYYMVYDSAGNRTLLHALTRYPVTKTYDNEMWQWNGLTWSQVALVPPLQASQAYGLHGPAVFDSARARLVVQSNGLGTWEFSDPVMLTGNQRVATGSTHVLTLRAGTDSGMRFQMGSSLGTGPLYFGSRALGLSADSLFAMSVSGFFPTVFVGYAGVVGPQGIANASIAIPNDRALVGLSIHSAFVTLDSGSPFGIKSISSTSSFYIY